MSAERAWVRSMVSTQHLLRSHFYIECGSNERIYDGNGTCWLTVLEWKWTAAATPKNTAHRHRFRFASKNSRFDMEKPEIAHCLYAALYSHCANDFSRTTIVMYKPIVGYMIYDDGSVGVRTKNMKWMKMRLRKTVHKHTHANIYIYTRTRWQSLYSLSYGNIAHDICVFLHANISVYGVSSAKEHTHTHTPFGTQTEQDMKGASTFLFPMRLIQWFLSV